MSTATSGAAMVRAKPISTGQGPTQRVRPWLHLLLIAGSFITFLPFLIMLLGSLVPKEMLLARTFTVSDLTLENYFATFEAIPFGRYYINSLIVSTATVLLQILTASLAA